MQIDWWTLGLQTINFLVVIWLLSRFLYRPIRHVIEEREAADRAASQAAQQKADAADQVRREYAQKRAQLAQEHNAREAAFHKTMEAEKEKTLNAARKEAADLLEAAREKIAWDQTQALQNLKGCVQVLAADLARSALRAPACGDDAIRRVTAHLDQLPQTDLDDLGQDLLPDGAGITVVTPDTLSPPQQDAWRSALSQRFAEGAAVRFREDPDILGGVDLHFPHAALRFSVADRLRRAAAALEGGDVS
jgi:F-type H+-transporting ATPase subunit b